MKSADDIEKCFRQATLSTDGTRHDAIFERILSAQEQSTAETPASCRVLIRSSIMKSSLTKIAAAAAIIAATTLGYIMFVGTGSTSGVVWAEVAERVQGCTGITYCTTQTQTVAGLGRPIEKHEMTYYSPKYGMKVQNCPGEEKTITTCINFADRTRTTLMHSFKKYVQDDLPEDAVPENQGQVIPKEVVRKFVSGEYKELGRQTIEGVLAEGIEVDNSSEDTGNSPNDNSVFRLWVSVETGYPVKLEADVVGNSGNMHIEMMMDQFQWDVELGAGEFRIDIPSDYTLMDRSRQ